MLNISDNTLSVLKSFATINPNIVLQPGQKVKTISDAKNILAVADIVEDFPTEMGLYDLNEFLSVLGLVSDPKLEFCDNFVEVKGKEAKIKYFFSDPSILTKPQKDITMPNCEVNITLTGDILDQVRRASSTLGHNEMSITSAENSVIIKVYDSKDTAANSYNIELDSDMSDVGEFNFIFNITNLKLIDGDYDVGISSKLISNWKNTSKPVEYFIALEKNSNYNSQ